MKMVSAQIAMQPRGNHQAPVGFQGHLLLIERGLPASQWNEPQNCEAEAAAIPQQQQQSHSGNRVLKYRLKY
jgi:hypothetical protein